MHNTYNFLKQKFIIMQNEEKSKKAWQTPECIDLDVNKTSGSKGMDGAESSTTGVGPS